MKNFYWGILCLLTSIYTPSFAQTKIQIIDNITKEPVSGVLITQLYPTDAVVKSTSDKNGFATVKFDGSRITLSNEDYYPLVIQQPSINKDGQVFLTPNIQTMDETVLSASRNLEKRKERFTSETSYFIDLFEKRIVQRKLKSNKNCVSKSIIKCTSIKPFYFAHSLGNRPDKS